MTKLNKRDQEKSDFLELLHDYFVMSQGDCSCQDCLHTQGLFDELKKTTDKWFEKKMTKIAS